MNEIAFNCTIYWHVPKEKEGEKALSELLNYLDELNLDYQGHDAEYRDSEGNVIETL